jgi:transcriptional regulator with XRE-family HTH domain
VSGIRSSAYQVGQTQDAERISLGTSLARLRKQQGVTGKQLGDLAGMSQAKVSKIENGVIMPSRQDVERLTRALHVPEDQVQSLLDQVEGMHDAFFDRRVTTNQIVAAQQEFGASEERARSVRVFQPTVVPGLLQTTEYARAILGDYARLLVSKAPEGRQSIAPAVSARIQRQEVLDDPAKQFRVVMTESVLSNRLCSPASLVAQLERIRTLARLANVSIRILPRDAELSYPPTHGFQLFDDDRVLIDLMNTMVVSRGGADIRVYREVFDQFFQLATDDIGPILDRYTRCYADLAAAVGSTR